MAINGVGFDSKETVQEFIDKIKSQRSEVYILSNQYSGATYTTVEALLEKVAADMLAKGGYGGAVGCVWTGKSYFSGTYGTNGSTAGNARLHFENAQAGYTECTFNFTSSGLGTVNWFNDVTTSTVTSGSTAPITSGAVAAVKETAEHAETDAMLSRGEIGDITALETTDQTDLVSAINEVVTEVAPALTDVYISDLKNSVTAESGVSVEDLKFVQKGKVCLLTTDMIMLTESKPQSSVLFTLPETVPAPKVGIYTVMLDIGHRGFVPVYISSSRQVSLVFPASSYPTIAGAIEYLTE